MGVQNAAIQYGAPATSSEIKLHKRCPEILLLAEYFVNCDVLRYYLTISRLYLAQNGERRTNSIDQCNKHQ